MTTPFHTRGLTPAPRELLRLEQHRLAELIAVRQRYADIADGDVLLAVAVVVGWSP